MLSTNKHRQEASKHEPALAAPESLSLENSLQPFKNGKSKSKPRQRRKEKSAVLLYSQGRLKKPQFGYDCEVAKEIIHRTRNMRFTGKFPGNLAHVMLRQLQPTWSNFLKQYGLSTKNLSVVERPLCFNGLGFMAPPDAHNEIRRVYQTRKHLTSEFWGNSGPILAMSKDILKTFNLPSFTISLLDRSEQTVKISINHGMAQVPRNMSLDGHAILSKNCFVILDATKDWRLAFNPLVYGPPFVHFYAGVPIMSGGYVVGVVAVYDAYARPDLPRGLVSKLTAIASFVETRLEATLAEYLASDNTRIPRSLIHQAAFKVEHPILLQEHAAKGLQHLNCHEPVVKSYEISKALMTCDTARAAMDQVCEVVVNDKVIDFAYVVEVRVSMEYEVPKVLMARYPNGVLCCDVKDHRALLGEKIKTKVQTRMLGKFAVPEEITRLDDDVHRAALDATYGMLFSSEMSETGCKSGLFIPFEKTDPKLVFDADSLTHLEEDEILDVAVEKDPYIHLRQNLSRGVGFHHLMRATHNNVLIPSDMLPPKKKKQHPYQQQLQQSNDSSEVYSEPASSIDTELRIFAQLNLSDLNTPATFSASQASGGSQYSGTSTSALKPVSLDNSTSVMSGGTQTDSTKIEEEEDDDDDDGDDMHENDEKDEDEDEDEDEDDGDGEKAAARRKREAEKAERAKKYITVYKRYGGFLLGAFSCKPKAFTEDHVEDLKMCVNAMDDVFGYHRDTRPGAEITEWNTVNKAHAKARVGNTKPLFER